MTRFDDLDRALSAYLDVEAAPPVPAGLLETAMQRTARHRPRPAWLARLRAGSAPSLRSETSRTLLIAAALAALLLLIVGLAILGGGSRPTSPLRADASAPPSSTPAAEPSSPFVAGSPLDEAVRATWLAITPALPNVGVGAGPVSMTISGNGMSLSAQNFAPGATFDSTVSDLGDGNVRLVLDRASSGCAPGAVGTYRLTMTDGGSLMALVSEDDACANRTEALARTWGRSLTESTSDGNGIISTMDPPFSVALPDKPLSSRTLDDFTEVGSSDGFDFYASKNPQGFVDPCSSAEERVPYTPGADAFADFLEQNPALETVSRDEVTIDGHRTVHIVVVGTSDLEACPNLPDDGYYIWTPKNCFCHFTSGPGTHDSLYLVEVGTDTFMFEVAVLGEVDETNPLERQVIDTLRIPARLPGG